MTLDSARPDALFALAIDDCEVQARCELPGHSPVSWRSSQGAEALAQCDPFFQEGGCLLQLPEEDPTNLLVQACGPAMSPLSIEVRSQKVSATEAVFVYSDSSLSEVFQISCPSSLRITRNNGILQVMVSPLGDTAPAQMPDTVPEPPTEPDIGLSDPPGPGKFQAQQEQLARQRAELDKLTTELADLQQRNDQLAQDIKIKRADLETARSIMSDRTATNDSLQKELKAALDANGLDQETLRYYTGSDGVNALLQESEALTARMDAALKKLIQERTQEAEDRFQAVT